MPRCNIRCKWRRKATSRPRPDHHHRAMGTPTRTRQDRHHGDGEVGRGGGGVISLEPSQGRPLRQWCAYSHGYSLPHPAWSVGGWGEGSSNNHTTTHAREIWHVCRLDCSPAPGVVSDLRRTGRAAYGLLPVPESKLRGPGTPPYTAPVGAHLGYLFLHRVTRTHSTC